MPRKKQIKIDDKNTTKNNLINTMFKDNNANNDEHIILQLPISQSKINNIINTNTEVNITEPYPYESNSYFMNDAEHIVSDSNNNSENNFNKTNSCCYWCCHPIDKILYGMPYNYDSINDAYLIYGSFCSLQCANAYNFSVHSGSDKVWEINSLIQMLSKSYGYKNTIRPAPSKYLLKMFNGNLDIEEYRKAHINNEKTYILNIPPMISLTASSEILNTSYLSKITDNKKNK